MGGGTGARPIARWVHLTRALRRATEGAGRRAHPNEQVVVGGLEITRDIHIVRELVIAWRGVRGAAGWVYRTRSGGLAPSTAHSAECCTGLAHYSFEVLAHTNAHTHIRQARARVPATACVPQISPSAQHPSIGVRRRTGGLVHEWVALRTAPCTSSIARSTGHLPCTRASVLSAHTSRKARLTCLEGRNSMSLLLVYQHPSSRHRCPSLGAAQVVAALCDCVGPGSPDLFCYTRACVLSKSSVSAAAHSAMRSRILLPTKSRYNHWSSPVLFCEEPLMLRHSEPAQMRSRAG